jgi:hypothetical protein
MNNREYKEGQIMRATGKAPNVTPDDDILSEGSVTVAGATAEFGIGRTRLYSFMGSGELTYSQLGDRRLIPRKAIKKLIAAKLVGV